MEKEHSREKRKAIMRFFRRAAAASLAGCLLLYGGAQVGAETMKDVFDEHYYADKYPDLKAAFGYDREALWKHYIDYGMSEGRSMNGLIDVVKYRKEYADLDAAFGDNWDAYVEHYLTYGAKEKRNTGTEYDILDYADRYADLQRAFGNDVIALWNHYQTAGISEGRDARDEDIIRAEIEAERIALEEAEREDYDAQETSKPEETQRPEGTPEPENTPKPENTPQPEETQAPEGTPEPENTPQPEETQKPSQGDFVQKGSVIDSGEYMGLDWLVTDAGELVVTGHMEGEGLEANMIWKWAPWNQHKDEIAFAYLNFTGAKNLRELFSRYLVLSEINLNGLDTSSVTDMGGMFYRCKSLSRVEVSS